MGWERVPKSFCTSNVTWRCGIQTITLQHGCNRTDVLATPKFTLLVKSLQRKRKIQCQNSRRRMLILFELFGAVFLFIWCGNTVPTPLCSALHICIKPHENCVFHPKRLYSLQNHNLPTFTPFACDHVIDKCLQLFTPIRSWSKIAE